ILGPDSVAAHKVADAFRNLAPEKYADFHVALLGTEGRASDETAIAVAASLSVSEDKIRAEDWKLLEDETDVLVLLQH
ncbi:DsbA family protein, partial [Rhizobium ruizarguesonis]